jgi:hypothetical protein
MMATLNKRYLGDSVYAEFDGWCIVLTTENGLPSDPSNTICIESGVWDALVQYHKDLLATPPAGEESEDGSNS